MGEAVLTLAAADNLRKKLNEEESGLLSEQVWREFTSIRQSSFERFDHDDGSLDGERTIIHANALQKKVREQLKSPAPFRPGEAVYNEIVQFLKHCDTKTVHLVASQWQLFVHGLLDVAASPGASLDQQEARDWRRQVVSDLVEAFVHLNPSVDMVTSSHLRLVRFALEFEIPEALGVLLKQANYTLVCQPVKETPKRKDSSPGLISVPGSLPKSHHPGADEPLNQHYILEYLSSIVEACISVKQFTIVLPVLAQILSLPVRSKKIPPSMLQAYKKWILICLYQHGRVLILPGGNSNMSTYKTFTKPYAAIEKAYVEGSWSRLCAEANQAMRVFVHDGHEGLVQLVLLGYSRKALTALERKYAAVPMEVMSEQVSLEQDQVRAFISDLSKQDPGGIALAEESPGVFGFRNNKKGAQDGDEEDLSGRVKDTMQRLKRLEAMLNRSRIQVALTKENAAHEKKQRRHQASMDRWMGDTSQAEKSGAMDDEDEELMED